jgi:hypothetical protein
VSSIVTKPKAKAGRPKTPQDVADTQLLQRIATLAAAILVCYALLDEIDTAASDSSGSG